MYLVKAFTKRGFISGCYYAAHAHVCVRMLCGAWQSTRDLCPSLCPAICRTPGGMDVLEAVMISEKISGRIKLNVIWIAVKERIVWQVLGKGFALHLFFLALAFPFPQSPPLFSLHFLSKSRYCSQAEYLFRFLCFAYVKPEWTYRRKREIILRDWEMWASGLGQAISWLITQLQGGAEKGSLHVAAAYPPHPDLWFWVLLPVKSPLCSHAALVSKPVQFCKRQV